MSCSSPFFPLNRMFRSFGAYVPISVIPDKAHRAADPGSKVQPRPTSTWTLDLRGCAACQG
jgi:hypothetical protein